MMNEKKDIKDSKKTVWIFAASLGIAIVLFALGLMKNQAYNMAKHSVSYSGAGLFSTEENREENVYVVAGIRDSTWTKAFDLNNEGITEHNYQAYTVDYTVVNNTKDKVSDFSFKLAFGNEVFLLSAWNGALEIHQKVGGGEIVDTVPDLREFVPESHIVRTFTADGETLIAMKPGDYLKYIPSSNMNALEMPIEPLEASTPGIILYAPMGESIENMSVDLEYTFHRRLLREPLFWVALALFVIWLLALIIFLITSAQIRKYKLQHERDNVIINESIETFTGFIDAKDPYTNGHSKRVAEYTKRIAQEFGYEGEELERIYYIALLHDCGKIGVPDNILGKPGKLTDKEFEIIKSHTVRGGEILSAFKSLENAGEGARYHHEKYNGTGYPEGKAGEDIPFIARMICVADSYDAMNTNRVYRDKLTTEHIIDEIEKGKGQQFDPEIADVALRLIKNDQFAGYQKIT